MWQCHDRNPVIKAFEKCPPLLSPFILAKRGVARAQQADAIIRPEEASVSAMADRVLGTCDFCVLNLRPAFQG